MRKTTEEYRQMRMGETKMMNCGMEATIIDYKNSQNVTIRFKNGITKDHVAYSLFVHGLVRYEGKSKTYAKKRLGETDTMRNGLKAIIIAYRTCMDMDVKFETGVIREHVSYAEFSSGYLTEEKQDFITTRQKKDRLHEKHMMNCGFEAEIIDYKGSQNMTIRFENGEIREHVSYNQFKLGRIAAKADNRSLKKTDRLGEKRTMNCGSKATIIRYGTALDVDVQFDDGSIREHINYQKFKNGNLLPLEQRKTIKEERLGETKVMDDGVSGTIISYVNSGDIDVSLENGTVIRHTTYRRFTNGLIHKRKIDKVKEEKTGQIIKLKNGDTCKIINYRNSRDVDIQFSDGTIRQHLLYGNIKKGYAAKV